MTAIALPDIKGCAPISVAGDTPVLNILKPVAETALANAFGNPVNGVVVADKVILNIGHFYKPGFTGIVDKGSITAPAIGIIVLKLRRIEKKPLSI